ncbi:unnamed protein product [Cladocopium goreaui]|uniref:Pentatricopeptide repeat-containing protein MRL1, chloroplastic (Protein MATURATION OF RBCL 1) (AtMRL1) n=1 Tax=Cladocopium goreaui TaxID=2562237 RepID=A0A9P1FK49_9DINO|nr:unnamed protein product [Cladocopium goreaui]
MASTCAPRKRAATVAQVTAAIRALTQRGLYREAAHFALDACAWGDDAGGSGAKRVQGNAFVCGAAFHACGFVSDSWPLTLQLLQRAQDAHVELDASAEDSLLLALCRGGAPSLALQRPVSSGLKALSAAAAHMGRSTAWEMSIALLAKSSHWDQTAWEVLVAAAADATQWPAALALLDAMGRRCEACEDAMGRQRDRSNTRSGGWGRSQLGERACAGVQRFDLAHQLLHTNSHDLPHETALTRLVVSAPSVGDSRWQWAMCVLDTLDQRQVKVPLSTCNAVISVCAQSGHWQRALSVLESMCAGCGAGPVQRPAPDQISFNGALSACERAARPEVAARLLQRMTILAIQPSVTSYLGLSAAYGRSTGWRMALSLFSTVRRRSLQPDEALLVATAMACGNQGFEKEAELIFQAQPWQHASQLLSTKIRMQPSAASTSCFTSCLEKGFQWARAVHSLEEAKQKDLKSLKSYGAALAACQQGDAWRAAVGVLEAGVEALESRPQLGLLGLVPPDRQMHQLMMRLRQQCEVEDPSVLATASYSMLYHGMLDAQLAAVLERKILRPCAGRLRGMPRAAHAVRLGPLADTVVLKIEYANEAARVAEQLQPAVGRVTIMSQEAHAARELADSTLREAKERQRAGVATGAQTMKVADRILELYGQGGSQRKRFWSSISMTLGVLSAQGFLGAAAPLFAQRRMLAPPEKLLRGRLEARRLHHLLGAPSAERSSLAAKSIPAFVTSCLQLPASAASASTLGRLVGHRSAAGESLLTSVLADHDRSQHAERQVHGACGAG